MVFSIVIPAPAKALPFRSVTLPFYQVYPDPAEGAAFKIPYRNIKIVI